MAEDPGGPDFGRRRQSAVYLDGVAGRRQAVPLGAAALEREARRRLSPEAFAYISGGAGLEQTMAANRAAFDRRRIVPRVLRDVSTRDTTVELFGSRLASPLLLAPIGVLEMAHREADLAVARAAAAEGVPLIFSNQASVSMEKCAAVMGDSPRWFQLYWSRSDELVVSFLRRAEQCGCSAIVLTLDTTMLGWRVRDLDLGYLPFLRGKGLAQYTSDPVFLASLDEPLPPPPPAGGPQRRSLTAGTIGAALEMALAFPGGLAAGLRGGRALKAVQRFVATYSRPSLTWDNLAWLREQTKLPILLKGIQHADDARQAVQQGMNGVIVSNHGGRQVDGAIGSLDALPGVVQAVAGRVPVLFDSGVRSGADVFKAVALGAKAVCVGRPYAWGLAVAGEAGVRDVIRNISAEFDLTMGLAGCAAARELNPGNLQADSLPDSR